MGCPYTVNRLPKTFIKVTNITKMRKTRNFIYNLKSNPNSWSHDETASQPKPQYLTQSTKGNVATTQPHQPKYTNRTQIRNTCHKILNKNSNIRIPSFFFLFVTFAVFFVTFAVFFVTYQYFFNSNKWHFHLHVCVTAAILCGFKLLRIPIFLPETADFWCVHEKSGEIFDEVC